MTVALVPAIPRGEHLDGLIEFSANRILVTTPEISVVGLDPDWPEESRIELTRFIGEAVGKYGEYEACNPDLRPLIFQPLHQGNPDIPDNFVSQRFWILLRALDRDRSSSDMNKLMRTALRHGLEDFWHRLISQRASSNPQPSDF